MKWSEMTTEERDRLMYVKVLGVPDMCNGEIKVGPVRDVPSRSGGIAWSYHEFVCDGCELTGQIASVDDAPKSPHKRKVELMPSYSTDMNATLSALVHLGRRFELVYNPNPTMVYKWLCKIEPASDDELAAIGLANTPIDALNFAVLQACGVEIEP